jgi:sarcosine oxidase subunit alpha
MNAGICRISIDGVDVDVEPGISVAAALMNARLPLRFSVGGEPRAALCGIGLCHECRVSVDGRHHQRSCMIPVAPGMKVMRDG